LIWICDALIVICPDAFKPNVASESVSTC